MQPQRRENLQFYFIRGSLTTGNETNDVRAFLQLRAEREEAAVSRVDLERIVAAVHLDLTIHNRDGSLFALVDVADAGRVVFRHGEAVVDA